jgi:hypothetical protein
MRGGWHLRTHVDHCVTILKKNVLCIGDVTPVLFKSMGKKDPRWMPYSSVHKCRRYDLMLDWVRDHITLSSKELGERLNGT